MVKCELSCDINIFSILSGIPPCCTKLKKNLSLVTSNKRISSAASLVLHFYSFLPLMRLLGNWNKIQFIQSERHYSGPFGTMKTSRMSSVLLNTLYRNAFSNKTQPFCQSYCVLSDRVKQDSPHRVCLFLLCVFTGGVRLFHLPYHLEQGVFLKK